MYKNNKIILINPISGISGDMFSASLIDLMSQDAMKVYKHNLLLWENILKSFYSSITDNKKLSIDIKTEKRKGLQAKYLSFKYDHDLQSRNYKDIQKYIINSKLDKNIQYFSLRILRYLGLAESHIHGHPLKETHFHEVGSNDSILDICSASCLYNFLDRPIIYSSPITVNSQGSISFSHGTLPLPAPATLEILKGIPIQLSKENQELVTPTGAAILKGLKCQFNDSNENIKIKVIANGYGAGTRHLASQPNILRVTYGEIL